MRRLLQSRRRAPSALPRDDGVVISCRVRLARNLAGVRFPDWNDEDGHFAVLDTILAAVDRTGALATEGGTVSTWTLRAGDSARFPLSSSAATRKR